ncbi:MAG: hypothetical protein ABNH26_10810 [Celeribacter sp.]|jgi:hypothetical protein
MKTISLILAATVAVTMPMIAEAKPDGAKAAKKYEKAVKKVRKEARKAAEKRMKDVRKQAKKGKAIACPPGLAKKDNGCTPPGLARKAAVRHDTDRRHDRDHVEREDYQRDRDHTRDTARAASPSIAPVAAAVAAPVTAPVTLDIRPEPRPDLLDAALTQDRTYDGSYREASIERDAFDREDVLPSPDRDVDIDGINNRPLVGERLDGDYVIIDEPGLYELDPQYTYYRDDDYVYRIDPDTREVLALIGVLENVLN